MATRPRRLEPAWQHASLADILRDVAAEVSASVVGGVPLNSEPAARPLWEPMPPVPGRGLTMPDGRVVSPQQMALESEADELFFGGGPGGGKTDFVLGTAITQHRNSIIFRREFTQLRGADGIIERSVQIIGDKGDLNRGLFVWRNLPGGRSLEFGAAKTSSDMLKYKGRPHDLKAFDEVPEFPESVYRFLIGWLRTSHPGQRTRVICTGNPPMTEEGQWVLKYWGPWLDKNHPNPAQPGELRWFVVDSTTRKDREVPGPVWSGQAPPVQVDGRWVQPRSRTFIPSQVEDNPYYMATGYAEVLDNLPEPLRSQMRFGDFKAAHGDHPWQVIPNAWVKAAQDRWTLDGGAGLPLTMVGNDPSRGGEDEFVIALRHDNWVAPLVVHQAVEAPDGPAGAALVFRAIGGDRSVPVQIDIIGSAGSSVYDHCKGLALKAVAMNGSAKSKARDKSGKLGFVNKRAEWHWKMRELLDPSSGQEMMLPPDPQLRSDLCAPRWTPTPRGIQIESKEDIQARIGRSPDRGEATIYGCVLVDDTAPYELLFSTGANPDVLADEVAALERQLGLR